MGWRQISAAILGLVLGLASILVLLSPRVTGSDFFSEPISVWKPLNISFNHSVDLESAKDHFIISPPVAGELLVDGNVLRFQPAEALVSGLSYLITIEAGMKGDNGLPLIFGTKVSFTVKEPSLLYLRDEGGVTDLWLQNEDGESSPLTDETIGVWDYDVGPDGRGILFSSSNAEGGMDLVLLSQVGQRREILACQESFCRSARMQPGDSLIAYERQNKNGGMDETEVWLLDTKSGQSRAALEWNSFDLKSLSDAGFDSPFSQSPRWSADGRYLSIYKPDARVIVVQDTHGGPTKMVPANVELMGDWSPDGHRLAYTELAFGQEDPHEHVDEAGTVISHTRPSLYQHLVISDFALDETKDLDKGLEVDNGRPEWHPYDQKIVVGRSSTGGGKQIWQLFTNESTSSQLTDDPFVNHTALSWSPDGRKLAFMRTSLADGVGEPGVWTLDLESGQMQMAAEGAYLPGWLE